jgi:hypothetical protein
MQPGRTKAGRTPLSAVPVEGRFRPAQAFRWQLLLLASILVIVIAPRSMAGQQTEDVEATVQHLINYVKESDVTFQRNTTRYTGAEAAEHINRKYQHFKDDIDTPEKFIELCATGSLMTGRPYLVITTQGEQQSASEWLYTELQIYRLRNEYASP